MNKKENVQAERELRNINNLSETVHGKVKTGVSNIRLSLSFRIAMHYVLQLIRSAVPIILIMTFLFCIACSLPIAADLKRISANSLSEGQNEYPREIIDNSRLIVASTESSPETDFFPRLSTQLDTLFSESTFHARDSWLSFLYTAPNGLDLLVKLRVNDYFSAWVWLLAGVILSDLIRMYCFVHNRNRLNKRVLAPIRDITEMAATLSESNLSNRINIAGTKNELKDLAQVINTMLDRIEHSYNSQKQFVSDASHELRTPIAVIRGYTDMLKRWGKEDPEVLDEGINAISLETESMKDLVENLLFLARHDKKTLMMEMSEFDPAEIVEEVSREESMVDPNHTFVVDPLCHSTLQADRNMLKQVIRILTDNAIKYSPAETEIRLGLAEKDGFCCITVTDHGQGIDAEELPKIFERFYRSDQARHSESGGHGLGLSIARIIVIAHRGKIRVTSKPGEGTTFTLCFPHDQPSENIAN